jgi:hypothetical protein
MHQRRSFLNDPNPGVAVTVNPPLVTLGQAEPPLQIEIVPDRLELPCAHEQPGDKADHHPGHRRADRILTLLEPIDQLLELFLAVRAAALAGIQGRRNRLDVLDVDADRLLFGLDFIEAAVDAAGQAAQLLFREPPFFSSKFRWIDSRTSSKASAIRNPGGCSGPPRSSLRMPRTAAQ